MLCRICRKQQAARANALAHAALTSVRTSAIHSAPRCLRKTVFANVIASRSFACRGPDTGSAKANGFPKHRQRTSPSFTDTCAGIQGGQHMFCMQMGVTRRSPHGRLRGSNLILECLEEGGGDFLEPIEQHEEGEPRWEERERGADACSYFNLSGSFGVPEVAERIPPGAWPGIAWFLLCRRRSPDLFRSCVEKASPFNDCHMSFMRVCVRLSSDVEGREWPMA